MYFFTNKIITIRDKIDHNPPAAGMDNCLCPALQLSLI